MTDKLRTGFGRAVAILAGGTILAQGITVLISPVLTRIYAPEDLGRLGLFLAFVLVASVALSLRYEAAVVSAASDDEALQLLRLSLLLIPLTTTLSISLLALLVVFGVGGYGGSADMLPWAAFAMLLLGGSTALRTWFVRHQGFAFVSRVLVLQSLTRGVIQIGLGLLGLGSMGLIAGEAAGRGAGTGRMLRALWRPLSSLRGGLLGPDARRIAGKYADFPRYAMPSSLVNALALYLPAPVIAHYYGIEAAGYFVLVQRVMTVPLSIVGASVADVFHARVAESSRLEPTLVRSLFRRTALSLLAIGLVPALIAVLAGGPLFELMFGPEWGRAGSIAAIVAPWMLAQFVVSPLGRLVFVFGAQRTKLIFDAISLVGTAAAIIVTAGAGMELESAILVLAAVQVAAYSLYFLLLVRLVRTAATAGDGPFTEV